MLAVPVTENPRLLARVAGALYLIITVCALFAYLFPGACLGVDKVTLLAIVLCKNHESERRVSLR
jgi:hypothetical protein